MGGGESHGPTWIPKRFRPFSFSLKKEKGLAKKKVVGGSLYRGLWVLTEEGKCAAEQVSLRAGRAVELAGKDLTDETRDIFYQALESITSNLIELSKEGIPE